MELLRRRSSMKDIAKDTGISVIGVQRVLGMMPVSKPQRLPQAVAFDEFKGDTGGERFQCIVADPLDRCVFDILPSRTAVTIQDYLRSFPNRGEVKYVVMDMNRDFRDTAKTFLPNAQIIIDRFHVVRCCTEAMENVRRYFQSTLPKAQRRHFKRSRRLLLAHRDRLSEEDRAAVDVMLRFSDRLLQAYALKETFYDFMAAPDRPTTCGVSTSGSTPATDSNLPEFKSCRKTLLNWRRYILNAFDFRLSNGFTEGCNNAIKTLKRVAFGFRSFRTFRVRILLAGRLPLHLTKNRLKALHPSSCISCKVRRRETAAADRWGKCTPCPSCGVRHAPGDAGLFPVGISTHAPLARCDANRRAFHRINRFQLTHLLRGATDYFS